jgi:hypothetical protein
VSQPVLVAAFFLKNAFHLGYGSFSHFLFVPLLFSSNSPSLEERGAGCAFPRVQPGGTFHVFFAVEDIPRSFSRDRAHAQLLQPLQLQLFHQP